MATPWRVPSEFVGRTVAVMASGPSMNAAVVEKVRAAGVPMLVTNDTFELAPDAWALVANDAHWWMHHAQTALKFVGHKVCVQRGCCPFPAVLELLDTGHKRDFCGFDPDLECIRTGGNSGFTALHIAMQAGAKRILLCGMDLGGPNWHGAHDGNLRTTKPETYAIWAKRFESLVAPAKERGIEILNCSPDSALKCFPFVELEDALEACVQPH